MSDYLAFDIGEEGFAGVARLESLDVVRAETVEKLLPICARYCDA